MAASTSKDRVVSFKADEHLLAALESVPNRSAFIRSAILAALDSACPLCGGSGVLSTRQQEHWQSLAADHAIETCRKCNEPVLTCQHADRRVRH